jgi:hypothetical protein
MDFPQLPPQVNLLCVERSLNAGAQPRSQAAAGVRVSGDERPGGALCSLHKANSSGGVRPLDPDERVHAVAQGTPETFDRRRSLHAPALDDQ